MNATPQSSMLTIAAATLTVVAFITAPAAAERKGRQALHTREHHIGRGSFSPIWALSLNRLLLRSPASMTPNQESPGKQSGGTVKKFRERPIRSKSSTAAK